MIVILLAKLESLETRIKSGVPQGSVIGLSVIKVTTLLFAVDVTMVSLRLFSDLLRGSLYNGWN